MSRADATGPSATGEASQARDRADTTRRPIRIANCSGFYGDRLSAAQEMVEGGPIDVLTGDYLAELTMTILLKDRMKDPQAGYAKTFLTQAEQVLGTCADRGIKIVVNAGGLNPAGLAEKVAALAGSLGLSLSVAHLTGDDLSQAVGRLKESGHLFANLDTGAPLTEQTLTAHAYLGSWGIAEALRRGADVVITGRTTDAALTAGPAAWWHGWTPEDLDALAGTTAAGHVIECGAQATGGNYAFFTEVPGLEHPGFPIAEVAADGSAVITKHPGTGGMVSVGTVTAQLLYEVGGPRYLSPDVTTRLDSLRLEQVGPDRVAISGARGEMPPTSHKVSATLFGGFRNAMTFVLTGLEVDAKADLVQRTVETRLHERGAVPETMQWSLVRATHEDPQSNAEAVSYLRVAVRDPDQSTVGKSFSQVCVELALASYPGFTMTDVPGPGSPVVRYWPTLVPTSEVSQAVVLMDGTVVEVPVPSGEAERAPVPQPALPAEPPTAAAVRVPLGQAFGARSGDKGGSANLGVWARSEDGYAWLAHHLTAERLRELLPEVAPLRIERYLLPNLSAVNFVIHGLLDEGVATSTRLDPQAKGLGEWFRARHADLPATLVT